LRNIPNWIECGVAFDGVECEVKKNALQCMMHWCCIGAVAMLVVFDSGYSSRRRKTENLDVRHGAFSKEIFRVQIEQSLG